MAVRQGNQVIQAFPSQCANEPFTKGVCVRTSWWRLQHPQPEVVDRLVKLRGENAITVMDEEAIGMVRRDRFAQVLERPVCCGMRGHIGMEDPARVACSMMTKTYRRRQVTVTTTQQSQAMIAMA